MNKKLKNAIKLSDMRQYQIARKAGIHHVTLSKLMNDIVPVKPGNKNLIAIGRVMGFKPEACFKEAV